MNRENRPMHLKKRLMLALVAIALTTLSLGSAQAAEKRDSFRIASAATEALTLDVECELLETELTGHGVDSQRAALAMKEAGCTAIVALGGDGTVPRECRQP